MFRTLDLSRNLTLAAGQIVENQYLQNYFTFSSKSRTSLEFTCLLWKKERGRKLSRQPVTKYFERFLPFQFIFTTSKTTRILSTDTEHELPYKLPIYSNLVPTCATIRMALKNSEL